ncbi:MAG TPA: ABC transporter substrate-binding protein [Paracoccus solventivorans]|uniref:ABC transporter substrate-binding protein n=1 Tax=Paracoccus solventivorans TaxID=53463 RepID=UPI002C1D6997|nr:ABC transporter substrate-binding protein [Paracoccus solventivorans]HMM07724.1 ABC transporter substrate-binding protein [Paracoccus solventivorans]
MKTTVSFAAVLLATTALAHAEISDGVVRIGVLTDMSGPYSDFSGPTSVEAARLAVEEFNGGANGLKVEIIATDHQNKADIAASTARQWFDTQGVDAIADMTNSAAAIAVTTMAKDLGKVTLMTGPATTELTNAACSPTGFHWGWDTYSQSVGTASALVGQGLKDWFLITADYAFGHQMAASLSDTVKANGGNIIGDVRHPLNTMDFSSFLLQAQASGAQVVGLANGGTDTVNAVKGAAEFGIAQAGQTIAALNIVISDVHAMGLETAQGLTGTTSFYHDRDDASREFAQRFMERTGRMPGMIQAGTYSSVLHYLRAVDALNSDVGADVAAKMRETPVHDAFAPNGRIREDGRMVTDMYLFQVKTPAESSGEWDYFKILATIPAEETATPLEQSTCYLVNG